MNGSLLAPTIIPLAPPARKCLPSQGGRKGEGNLRLTTPPRTSPPTPVLTRPRPAPARAPANARPDPRKQRRTRARALQMCTQHAQQGVCTHLHHIHIYPSTAHRDRRKRTLKVHPLHLVLPAGKHHDAPFSVQCFAVSGHADAGSAGERGRDRGSDQPAHCRADASEQAASLQFRYRPGNKSWPFELNSVEQTIKAYRNPALGTERTFSWRSLRRCAKLTGALASCLTSALSSPLSPYFYWHAPSAKQNTKPGLRSAVLISSWSAMRAKSKRARRLCNSKKSAPCSGNGSLSQGTIPVQSLRFLP